MTRNSIERLLRRIDFSVNLMENQKIYGQYISSIFTKCKSQFSKAENIETGGFGDKKGANFISSEPMHIPKGKSDSGTKSHSLVEESTAEWKWKLEVDWLSKALEPAFQLFRSALTPGSGGRQMVPPTGKSLSEILASLKRSKIGIQDWSLGDLTVGLYLIYLRQASTTNAEDINGVQMSSDTLVQDLIYHIELAKGSYKDDAAALARNSMLQEKNILKFVKNSSVLRPGYYIGVDPRNKLVVFGIRGTHTVYDLITDMISSSVEGMTFESFSSHFGTAESARWFIQHELQTIKECMEKHEGYRLRLVGHSLGAATAALLAIMLRKRPEKDLGFDPNMISAIGFGSPPCVSKDLAECCASFVFNVVLQDDVIPRLSVASLAKLRNEILETDWNTILEREDWKSFVDLVTNARQVVSSVQDVARKVAEYAKFGNKPSLSGTESSSKQHDVKMDAAKNNMVSKSSEELFVPGTIYFIKRHMDFDESDRRLASHSLWRTGKGHHFGRIVLSGNFISDHKCDNHYYALRDILKTLPKNQD